jgi:hypothetical protein
MNQASTLPCGVEIHSRRIPAKRFLRNRRPRKKQFGNNIQRCSAQAPTPSMQTNPSKANPQYTKRQIRLRHIDLRHIRNPTWRAYREHMNCFGFFT